MLNWFYANLIDIVLVTVIVLITGFLIHVMIRDKKTGKSPCGGNCSSCGACAACNKYGCCSTISNSVNKKTSNSASYSTHL